MCSGFHACKRHAGRVAGDVSAAKAGSGSASRLAECGINKIAINIINAVGTITTVKMGEATESDSASINIA